MTTNIFMFANTKGGVGKSTNTLLLALKLAENHQRVLLIDYDDQANLTHSLIPGYAGNLSARSLVEKSANITPHVVSDYLHIIPATDSLVDIDNMDFSVFPVFKDNILAVGDSYDYVLIDAPGYYGTRIHSAMYACNSFCAPVVLHGFSLDGLSRFQELVNTVTRFNPQLRFLGVVPSMVRGISYRDEQPSPIIKAEKEALAGLKQAFPENLILPAIGYRDAYRQCCDLGSLSPLNATAKTELSSFTNAVTAKLMETSNAA